MWTTIEHVLKTAVIGSGLLLAVQAANAATITFDQTNLNVVEGNPFTLTLVGQNFATGVGGATADGTLGGGVSLSWDASVITLASLVDVDLVFPGDQFFGSAVPVLLNTAAGTLSFSVASFIGTSLTAFDIAELTFTAANPGSSAVNIAISALDVWADGVGAVNVNPTAVNGTVTVTEIAAVPLPAPVLLLGSGMIGMLVVSRGSSSRKEQLGR